MTADGKLGRRDLLRLGGLSAVTLPVVTTVGIVAGDQLLRSEERYGGFTVRTRRKGDSPFVFKPTYTRYHSKNAMFSRLFWDLDLAQRVSKTKLAYELNDPGYSHVDSALTLGAGFVGQFAGTNAAITDRHEGLLALEPEFMNPPTYPVWSDRWDHTQETPEGVAKIVKRAARYYGASLVGIAPLDPRWIYSGYFDLMNGSESRIEITEVEAIELPPGQMAPRDAGRIILDELRRRTDDEIKDTVVSVLREGGEDSGLPGVPPIDVIQGTPADQLRTRIGMLPGLPTDFLRLFAQRLNLQLDISDVDPEAGGKPRYLEDGTLLIPETMKTVIVLAFEMNADAVAAHPTNQGDAATMAGYSKMAVTASSLGVFLRGLGYNAIACANNTGISVPMAIQAGLGEVGRHGMLITPKFGPRVRLAKVITDLPMAHDAPIRFGVEEFCTRCRKCVRQCPTQAIPNGPKSSEAQTVSNLAGVRKWSVHPERCYAGWVAHGSGCGICVRVCPFNKPDSWLHAATRTLIGARSETADRLVVKVDDASGYAEEPRFRIWNDGETSEW